jgi:hypothetical protein
MPGYTELENVKKKKNRVFSPTPTTGGIERMKVCVCVCEFVY